MSGDDRGEQSSPKTGRGNRSAAMPLPRIELNRATPGLDPGSYQRSERGRGGSADRDVRVAENLLVVVRRSRSSVTNTGFEIVMLKWKEVLEAEMTEALGAEKGERTAERQGYRSGYYGRTLITRIGKLELRVPQDRGGRFSTELFERYQRSERALVAALAEMYVQGVSTRKVKAITEELCGHSFSASSISAMNQRLDASLAQFAGRGLAEAFPYLILDARYERVREAGVIVSQAV